MKTFIFVLIISTGFIFVFLFRSFFDKTTTVVFCDVGQGDGTYIRTSNNIDILIDAGPDNSILRCLGKYMPFYDRKIEMAFLSHPQIDHFGGFLEIVNRYTIDIFVLTDADNKATSYQELKERIKNKQINQAHLYKDDIIRLDSNKLIKFYWPSYGYRSNDPNDVSQIFMYEEDGNKILMTGDASPKVLDMITTIDSDVNILKVPHHGSVNGLTEEFLLRINPQDVVISVAKKNRYGHPSPEIISLLQKYKIPYHLTSEEGDIKIDIR